MATTGTGGVSITTQGFMIMAAGTIIILTITGVQGTTMM